MKELTYADQVLYLQPHRHTHFVLRLEQVFLEYKRKKKLEDNYIIAVKTGLYV